MVKSLIRLIKFYKINVILLAVFVLMLLTLPQLTELFVPCLKSIPGDSYVFSECNVGHALNYYLMMAIIGLAVIILLSFFFRQTKKLTPLLIVALVCTGLTIVAFHLYIPHVEAQVKKAAIILETESFKH